MNKFFTIIFVALIFISCNNEDNIQKPKEVQFSIDFDFNVEIGVMTKTIGSYNDFYENYIKTKKLVPSNYCISFTSVERGDSIVVRGRWDDKNFFKLKEGKYRVKGVTSQYKSDISGTSAYISQDSVPLSFNEVIDISTDIEKITLNAEYDCALLLWDKENIEQIRYGNFSPKTVAANTNDYFYMFIKNIEFTKINTDPLNVIRKNGNVSEIWLGTFDLQKGKYYYFKDIEGDFIIHPMTE